MSPWCSTRGSPARDGHGSMRPQWAPAQATAPAGSSGHAWHPSRASPCPLGRRRCPAAGFRTCAALQRTKGERRGISFGHRGAAGGGSVATVRGAAAHPSRTTRGRPCASCRRCTRAEVEGVGGAWVASTASAIFSNSLVRKKFQKVGKLYFLVARRLRSAQLMTLARRPRKVATTPSRRGERPWPGLQRAASVRQSSRAQRAELSPAGRVVPAAPASAATCRSGRWRADADDDV